MIQPVWADMEPGCANSRRQHGLPISRRLRAVAAATLLVFVVLAISGQAGPADSDQQRLPRATLTLTPAAAGIPIPRSYLGLSTEYWTLPLYARHLATFERVLALIHVTGNGPMVLRFGGDSADHSFWDPRRRRLPPWAFSLTPTWTGLANGLVHQVGVRLIIDLNLVTDSPETAAIWAQAAEARLPHGSIIGFEVGNEPDIYSHSTWLRLTAGDLRAGTALPRALPMRDYLRDFRVYARRLHELALHVPLIGPALAEPRAHSRWVRALLAAHVPGLGLISVHRYPYSGCVSRRSASFPTVARILTARASTVLAARLVPMIATAHRAGLPFRLTELNSVTCGGRPRVSDTFATALWAPDTLFALLHARADGVNVHVRANTINAPFAFTARGLFARPLLYGLIMFTRALDGAASLVPAHLRAARPLNLSAWVVRTRTGALHVLALDKGRRSVQLLVRVPGRCPARLERLRAARPGSRFGVTLDGQRLSPHGAWTGRQQTETVARTRHGYLITLPRFSAALIVVPPAPSPLEPLGVAGLEPIS